MASPIPIRVERTQGPAFGPTDVQLEDGMKGIREGSRFSEQQLVDWLQPGVAFFLKRSSLTGIVNKVDVSEVFRLAIFFIKTGAVADSPGLKAMLIRFAKSFGETRAVRLRNPTDPQAVPEACQNVACMREALSEISESAREAFVARYVEGKSTDEICRQLNITIEELTSAIQTVRRLYAGRRVKKTVSKSNCSHLPLQVYRSDPA